MTVPVSGNTNVVRSDAADTFRVQITNPVNAIPKWHSSNNPAGGNAPNGSFSSASPALLSSVLLPGDIVTTSPVGGELALGNVSASATGALLQNTAIVLSRARSVRLIKYYNNSLAGVNSVFFDQTAISHLNSAYQLGATGVPNPSGTLSAGAFNSFVAQLEIAVTNHRNAQLIFTEQWCHSSCHSSHASRGRR